MCKIKREHYFPRPILVPSGITVTVVLLDFFPMMCKAKLLVNQYFKPVILGWGWFWLPLPPSGAFGNIWKHCRLSSLQGGGCPWHLVGGGQRGCSVACEAPGRARPESDLAQLSAVPKMRNPVSNKSWSKSTCNFSTCCFQWLHHGRFPQASPRGSTSWKQVIFWVFPRRDVYTIIYVHLIPYGGLATTLSLLL